MIKWRDHPEYVEFLKSFIPGHTESEIMEAFNDKFGIMLNEAKIGNFKHKHQVKSGTHGGRFQKGCKAHNKGKKMSRSVYKKVKSTMFKKGHMPHNHKEVGSERLNVDGYIEIKVAEPKKWMLKQRHVYEKHYGVKLSSNEVIVFLDGDRQNFDINNLYKLTRSGLARYNQDHLYTANKQISLAAAQIAEIKDRIGREKQ